MNYSCLEELQVAFDLSIDKIDVLSNAGCKYQKNNWLIVTDDGICHLFDKDGNLDDIKKVTCINKKHIRKDITKIVIPNSVICIENWAFEDCSVLTSVTIPDSVTSIGYAAFEGCNGLTDVTIGNRVTRIGNWAFEGCTNLTSVIIGSGVISIRNWAFKNCNKLSNLTFKDKTFEKVKKMKDYPWGIEDESIINVK